MAKDDVIELEGSVVDASVRQQEEIPLLRDDQHELSSVPSGQREHDVG